MTGKTFHQGLLLVPRLQSRNLQPVGDRELAVVKRALRDRDQFGEGNATFLCGVETYVVTRSVGSQKLRVGIDVDTT